MNRTVRKLSKWMIVLVLATMGTISAYAQEDCSNKNLNGAFGFLVAGTNVDANVLFAISGRFVSDGNGSFTGTGNQSVAGRVIEQFPFTGHYVVAPDCTGAAVFSFPGGLAARLDFVLVDNGNEIIILDADQGTVEYGRAKKQFTRHQGQEPEEQQ